MSNNFKALIKYPSLAWRSQWQEIINVCGQSSTFSLNYSYKHANKDIQILTDQKVLAYHWPLI